jgi:hypothetical protein
VRRPNQSKPQQNRNLGIIPGIFFPLPIPPGAKAHPILRRCRMEKHISSTCRNGKSVRHRQRATLVRLQRNFLCQHNDARDQMTFRHKAPTNKWTASAVKLVDIHRGAVANSVSLSAVAAGDLKIAFRAILRELLRRQPLLHQLEAARFPFPVSVAKARENREDGSMRSGCRRKLARIARALRPHSDRNGRRRSFALRKSGLNIPEVSNRRAAEKTASLRR